MALGTTIFRVCLYKSCAKECKLVFSREEKITLVLGHHDFPDCVEIKPSYLWQQFRSLIKDTISKIPDSSKLISLALCCQRNTFVTWNKKTLETCHNLITWKDGRARQACASWNSSWTIKTLNLAGGLAHFVTRSERFKAARMFSFLDVMVTHRFLVTLKHENSTTMRQLLEDGNLALGCLDTWLISKMTNGKVFVTEPSSASATGMYDPFLGDWGRFILRLVNFPVDVLPEVVETAQLIATSDSEIFGIPVKIAASLGDSQAAAFGACCIKKNSIKISLGTGTFLDYVGDSIHASMKGMYPLVGWKIRGKSCYLVEGRDNHTSKCIEWASQMKLFPSVEDSSNISEMAVADRDLCFLPIFTEAQTSEKNRSSAFRGFKSTTTKAQMLHAVLESIAFRVCKIWENLCAEVEVDSCLVRLCGGVANNNFICQQITNLLGINVERVAENQFSAAKGAVLLAGVATGAWTVVSIENGLFTEIDKVFCPNEKERAAIMRRYNIWKQNVKI